MAEPMRPAPTRTACFSREPFAAAMRSRFALRFEDYRGDGIVHRLAGPDHEVESRQELVRSIESRSKHGCNLPAVRRDTVEHRNGVAENGNTFVVPVIEMAEPQALIDLAQQFRDRRVLRVRRTQV